MNIDDFRENLEHVHDRELFRWVQRCVCQTMSPGQGASEESHTMLDLVYSECARRGKERLYDKAYETVCREPGVCKVFMA
ncbi:MAG TPA: hypothetical protein ENJ19_11670 [Gammaproteobacteria bacterium]|nr:hypothetical protein [Gammaproteobacteria bacterium]